MPDQQIHTLLRQLRRAVGPDSGTVPDAQLLHRFIAGRDAVAFETLVWRHGPMVLATCRRVLRHEQDAEDAFQAAFLALARKAGTIGRREAVAGWLYRVARRAAQHLRSVRARHPELDELALLEVAAPPEPDPAWADIRTVLDEEVGRLPRQYREVFILCCLEGLTDAEAARQLGCPLGTVLSRLSRARQRLRQRLTGCGLGLTAGAFALALGAVTSPPASAAALRLAVRVGSTTLTGTGAAGVLPPRVIALTEGVLRAMSLTRLKIIAAARLIVVALATAVGIGVYRGEAAGLPDDPAPAKNDAPPTGGAAPVRPAPLPLVGHKGAVHAVAFAPDGKAVATAGADGTVRIWDLTGKETLKLDEPGEAVGVAFAPNGKTMVTSSASPKGTLTVRDPATGKIIWRKNGLGGTGAVAFGADGRQVAVAFRGSTFTAIDATTEGMLFIFEGTAAKTGPATATTFSPDGKFLAAGDGAAVYLVASSGRLVQSWPSNGGVTALVFSADGTKVAVADSGKAVRILDVSNGQEAAVFASDEEIRAFALSPDGKQAATAGKGGKVRLWDVASGKEERRFDAAERAITALAFAPDGERLAAAGGGGAVVWDLTRDEKPPPKDLKLTEKELTALWADLARDDGGKVYAALRLLRADPTRSVPFLRERLKPRESGVDEKKVKQLITDLDADDFETRDKATNELEKLGKAVEPALRQALVAEPSLETKRRLERLLKPLGGDKALTPEQRRDVRAVRVLEQAGTPEAKKLLKTLMKESPGWWVTQEAKAALERQARRDKKP